MLQNNLGRFLAIISVVGLLAAGFLYTAGLFGSKDITAQTFVNLQEGKSASLGFRRAHAKGICVSGEFESNGALAAYSVANVFQPGSSAFVGRFSIAGNNPLAPDLKAPVRSLALGFSVPSYSAGSQGAVKAALNEKDQQWRLAMNTPPVMAVSTPEDFYEQLVSLSPDPKTGQRDVAKIQAFFAAHPESKDFNDWRDSYTPTNSFAAEQYHSINAFYLIDSKGHQHAVRWKAVPSISSATSGEKAGKKALDHTDALQLDLTNKLQTESVKFDLVFSFANASDNENDPAIAWPKNRKTITAGTINIMSSQAQSNGACDGIRFDPLILPKGIEPTADPILNARSAAYAESYRRRAREKLLGQINAGEEK
jgi:catalase